MKKLLFIPILLLLNVFVSAQYTIKFLVHTPEPTSEKLFIAGSFNKWNPSDENYQLISKDASLKEITLSIPPGLYEYKFTRGNWTTVESTEAGLDIVNRVFRVNKDTTIQISIKGWMDRFRDVSKLPDTAQWQLAYNRSFFYLERNLDSSYKYAKIANNILQRLEGESYEAAMSRIFGRIMQRQGNHERALEFYLKQLDIVTNLKDTISIAFCLLDIGHLFLGIKDYEQAKSYYYKVKTLDPNVALAYGHSAPNLAQVRIGRIHYLTEHLDSARYYAQQAYQLAIKIIDRKSQSESLTLIGDILAHEGKFATAITYYKQAVEQAQLYNSSSMVAENFQHIARAFHKMNQTDSAFNYARKAFYFASELKNPFSIADASNLLAFLYKSHGQKDSAFKYLEMVVAAKDSLFTQEKSQQVQNILFNEQLQKQEIAAQKQEEAAKDEKFKTQIKMFALIAGMILLLLQCIFLWLNNRRKQRLNALLNKRGQKIQKTLAELKATQSQLIHKEKMASLGELTAGIAHEIQNPLNFINNFSEVSVELAKEMKDEVASLDIPTREKENMSLLADDLVQNQLKIREHGHRADAIVKGMLQHSRQPSGQREEININTLADEFLRLSYHGIRAKDKTFNAYYKTDFDENIGKVTVVPQNIGRVLLNLYNNAFYSVSEKKRALNGTFEPTVWVSTKKLDNKVEICVRDNGMGISEEVVNKIFQPFYTTKPSGHGTGLGLSLSYDIITKEHRGTLKVDTKQGDYAQFIIQLPLS
ncbi:MAG TPA: tetratricopeptide repeat protein [Chitinophagaceae bacterium]|nr:tetratricopeptide repeat protein [Chitinophagaceae bacterium]